MSGGSYNYIYCKLEEECSGSMYDAEMNDLITDLCDVLHDLEWWQSGDSSEEVYRETVTKFKKKWFMGNRDERLRGYIDKQLGIVRHELYALIGEKADAEKNEEVHMTNREKFEQVFHTPITDTEYLHGCLVCPDDVCNAHPDCKDCPYDDWWYQEYKGGTSDDNE